MSKASGFQPQTAWEPEVTGDRGEPEDCVVQTAGWPAYYVGDTPDIGHPGQEEGSDYQSEMLPSHLSSEYAYVNPSTTNDDVGFSQLSNGLNPYSSIADGQPNECIDPLLLDRSIEFHGAIHQTQPARNLQTHGAGEDILEYYSPQHYDECRNHVAQQNSPMAPPWSPLAVNSAQSQPGVHTQPQRMYQSASSYGPSASIPDGSGHSSLSNGGGAGTSATSNETWYSHLMESTETMQPPLVSNDSVQALSDRVGPLSTLGHADSTWPTYQDNGLGPSSGRVSFFGQQLPIPQTTRHRRGSSSAASVASSVVPDDLRCKYYDCRAKFTGKYRIGNLGRHMRTKHGANGQQRGYPCGEEDCPKTYMRQDARLKHYRKEHPTLAAAAAESGR